MARQLQDSCHQLAYQSGWWHDLKTGEDLTFSYAVDVLLGQLKPPRNIGELLCLVHSEVSEAMEGARKGLMDDKLPHRTMLEVELADAVIRIFDMAGGLDLDLPGAIVEKLAYNAKRADHQREHRAGAGGKQF
jgi:NTP pyrophosphatase (non-canonical NTP hydrolase)